MSAAAPALNTHLPWCHPEIPLPDAISESVFRDPNQILPLIAHCKDFVVYYISAHSDIVGTTEVPQINVPTTNSADSIVTVPYAIAQTGGAESIGCAFGYGSDDISLTLFSKDLYYSLWHLLGLSGSSLPRYYEELHYATSDVYYNKSTGSSHPEIMLDRILEYYETDITPTNHTMPMGVYMYDPREKPTTPTIPLFKRLDELDMYFTSSDPTTGRGIRLSELLPIIPREVMISHGPSVALRPSLFVIMSCATLPVNMSNASFIDTVRTATTMSHYSIAKPSPSIPYLLHTNTKHLPNIVHPHRVGPTLHNYRYDPNYNYIRDVGVLQHAITSNNGINYPENGTLPNYVSSENNTKKIDKGTVSSRKNRLGGNKKKSTTRKHVSSKHTNKPRRTTTYRQKKTGSGNM